MKTYSTDLSVECQICYRKVYGLAIKKHLHLEHANKKTIIKCPICRKPFDGHHLPSHMEKSHKKRMVIIQKQIQENKELKKYERIREKQNIKREKFSQNYTLGFSKCEFPISGKRVPGGAPGLGKKR